MDMHRSWRVAACAGVIGLLSLTGAASGQCYLGDHFTARHTSPGPARMSGLIFIGVYGSPWVIAAPGNPADDLYFTEAWGYVHPGVGAIWTFIITEPSPGNPANEGATVVSPACSTQGIYLIPMLENSDTASALALHIDGSVTGVAYMTPPAGTFLEAMEGQVYRDGVRIDGWFAGRTIDYGTGVVSDAYTGGVFVRSTTFDATAYVPAPAAPALLMLAACRGRRR